MAYSQEQLTEKQKRFCQEYIIDFNGAQSAIRAGYSKKSAKEISSENLTKPNIQEYIKELIKEQQIRTEVTADKVLKELSLIAFFDVGLLYNDDGTLKPITELPEEITKAIHSVKNRIEKQGQDKEDWAEIKEIRSHDKLRALELIGKYFSMFTDKVEHSGKIESNISIYIPHNDRD